MPDKTTPHIEKAARAIAIIDQFGPGADSEEQRLLRLAIYDGTAPDGYLELGLFPEETVYNDCDRVTTGKDLYCEMATAALSATLEPSEAEIETSAIAMSAANPTHVSWNEMLEQGKVLCRQMARACLIAAARVRVGNAYDRSKG